MTERQSLQPVPVRALGPFSVSAVGLGAMRLAGVAAESGCTAAQACLAWQLAMAPTVLLIPGTSSLSHLRENVAAARVHLDSRALQLISQL
jgi:pyridoxine 4-dehydrogenase